MNKFNVEVLTEAKLVDIIYFVREHDTIYSISNTFYIDAKQIIEDNNLSSEENPLSKIKLTTSLILL